MKLSKKNHSNIEFSAYIILLIILLSLKIDAMAQADNHSSVLVNDIQFATTSNHQITKSIHYAYSGNINKPGILFIHGTPGSWDAFQAYLANGQLQKDFFMISVDRLGWGLSKLEQKRINGDFKLQAHSINNVLEQYPNKNWTLVGHSLGASIAPKVALLSPKKIKSLLLLAGSLKPDLGKPRWYNRAANTWAVSRLIGKNMRSSNREIMALHKQLTVMDKEIKASKLNVDLVIMQGGKDRLVSPQNPTYIDSQWRNSFKSITLLELEKEGHFLPWKQTALVIDTLYQLNP